ncbi:MAG: type II toxin-antitoxin system RelE/ParE family toxin [Bacteroidales bacterium]
MALKIKWSKRADNSFDRIIVYLHAEWGEQVVQAFVRKTYDFLEILAEFPEIGSMQFQKKAIRGFVLIKQVIVFYKVQGNSIILIDFFDTRQNPQKKE